VPVRRQGLSRRNTNQANVGLVTFEQLRSKDILSRGPLDITHVDRLHTPQSWHVQLTVSNCF